MPMVASNLSTDGSDILNKINKMPIVMRGNSDDDDMVFEKNTNSGKR